MNIKKLNTLTAQANLIVVAKKDSKFDSYFSEKELNYISKRIEAEDDLIEINRFDSVAFLALPKQDDKDYMTMEASRKLGFSVFNQAKAIGIEELVVVVADGTDLAMAFAEGLALSTYKFDKYLTKKDEDKKPKLETISVFGEKISEDMVKELQIIFDSVVLTKTLVNEPVSYMTAPKLAEEIKKMGAEAKLDVTVLEKKKIESLNMGGLLAVNKGSIDPPTFSIMEWKPKEFNNKKPIVLVGKGVVFDTGGLSLKPTKNSMDQMKCDMAGAASVIGVMRAVAMLELPLYVVALVPATDNRPDGNAYAPGDIIKMYNGMTVEVLNTDAEGRMILADALSFSDKYEPELVIDVATLTGAAANAIGSNGIVAMGNMDRKYMDNLVESGNNVFERIAEFPFWDDYAEDIKSDIADLKNIGGPTAGAITAGKFLEKFTSNPYIHLDIAGPAFVTSQESYKGKWGTGVSVRLLVDFLKNYSK
jgi:leucyl aminopeptidase